MAALSSGAALSPWTRQRVTLVFTDLSGSTRLGRAVEPETLADVVEAIRQIWRLVASRHGARIVRTQGDGAVILFGFPQLREDDGYRAAAAALEIHDAVARLSFDGLPSTFVPLAMHTGIHAGTLLLSPGDMERGHFDLAGDVANTAAQLADMAKPGQIIASVEALGPHDNFFEIGRLSLNEACAAPVEVRLILRHSGIHRRFDATARRGLTPLVGRESVTRRIRDFLAQDDAQARETQRCMVLVGPPGMGKTRLLEEVRDFCPPEFLMLRGGCESYLGAEVLQPFAQIVRQLFGLPAPRRMADLGPDLLSAIEPWRHRLDAGAEVLLHLLTTDAVPDSKRVTTGGVVGDLLAFFEALAQQQPVLLTVDDWQWADDASLQLLGALLNGKSGPRVLLASRPREDGAKEVQGALHIHLDPLQQTDAQHAIHRWLPHADPFLCAQIHEYSGGTPLFIEELCHSASVGALSRAIEERGAARNWLASLAVARLNRLPATLADVVRAAAVIGNEVPLWTLESVLGYAARGDPLSRLANLDFLHPTESSDVVRFNHGITRDAVYQSIGLSDRTAYHQRVLAALSQRAGDGSHDEHVEALAHHSRGAGLWEQACEFAERAGDKATTAFAMDRARVHYEFAMTSLDRKGPATPQRTRRWCGLSHKLGMTCIFDPLTLGDDPSVFERAVALAQELGDPKVLALSKYWLAYICYGLGRFRQSLRHAREALDLARQSGESRLAVQIEATMGQVLAATCDYSEAIERIDVAVDAKRQRSRPRGGLAIGSAYSLACKGGILADRGEFAAAHHCFDEAIDLLAGSTHPVGNSVRNWIAVAFNWQGRWAEAHRVASDSLRIAENTRALLLLSAARSSSGYAAWALDGSATGLEQQREAMQWMDQRHGRFYTSIYSGWLVAGCVTEGLLPEARAHAYSVFQRARQGERLGEGVACRSLAWVALDASNEAAAARWMHRAEAAARRRGSLREAALNQWMHGQIALRLGQAEQARRSLNNAVTCFDQLDMAWHSTLAQEHALRMAIKRPVFN